MKELKITFQREISHIYQQFIARWPEWRGRSYVAMDTEYGFLLDCSDGHSKSGNARRYFIFRPDKHAFIMQDRPYSEWRISFRAWSHEEAIEYANTNKRIQKKLATWTR